MNLRRLLLVSPLLLGACAPGDKTPSTASAAVKEADDAQPATAVGAMLADYLWKLESATDAQGRRIDALFPGDGRTLALSFEGDRLGVTGGCNRLAGRYTIDAKDQLKVGNLRSTMMACAAPLMQADQAISALLSAPQQTRVEQGVPPAPAAGVDVR
jgi:heat shock protein HslJ